MANAERITDEEKYVYSFGAGGSDGNASMKDLLGGKGANLAEMSNLGLPVPPGFTITTDACLTYFDLERQFPPVLEGQVREALAAIGQDVNAKFGDVENPLLVSVRSGARASMPGMMDTVLNLGLNDETVVGLATRANDERFAYDSYRRFIQMYSDVVLGVDHGVFEDLLENYKMDAGFSLDTDMQAGDWKEIVKLFRNEVERELKRPFPQDVHEQLWGAIGAVFSSWQNARAITYRRLHDIPDDWGTAVNVQAMVFGNMGETSATGVAFTRNPSTGENELYGEFLVNAQGEDVVAGIRTPQNLTKAARIAAGDDAPSLEEIMPEAFAEFEAIYRKLEDRYRDMQDVEFTIQDGKLWMLQTRSGKRTGKAALKIAVDLAEEGKITKEAAILQVDPEALDQLLHPTIDPSAERNVVARGLPASPGAASGEIVFTPDEAENVKGQGRDVLLVRIETSPEDIHGMHAANGVLTTRGGMTSHAAVVARGMGRPCVSGAGQISIDYKAETMTVLGKTFSKGDVLTIDGSTGEVLQGEVKMQQPELTGDFGKLMAWADEVRRLGIRTNADTPTDARQAREFGAEGIGLVRTEHMFFEADRILAVREMILSETEDGRRAALDKILPMQRDDFTELFRIMAGLPLTIRLLDPPLHEFLPKEEDEIAHVAQSMGVEPSKLLQRTRELEEVNPMLGFRGCRLAVSYPEITQMQTRAIIEAAIAAEKETGEAVTPEIMVPLIVFEDEFDMLRKVIVETADTVQKEAGHTISYQVGTMVELPRACLRANEIARTAEFFSFGTNDLTQTCFGLSRDDAGPILATYMQKGLMETDPFISIDQSGVGELVEMGTIRGRAQRPDIKLGICGEHGGDPASVAFCEKIGLDYVSCSPYRVPIARLAAAQAALRQREQSPAS